MAPRPGLYEAAAGLRGAVHEAVHSLETLVTETQAVKTPPRMVVLYSDDFPKWWAEKLLEAFLADGLNANMLSLAERIDNGEITKARANLVLAEVGLRITAEEAVTDADWFGRRAAWCANRAPV